MAQSGLHIDQPPTFFFLGVRMTVLLSGEQTGGQFSMIEGVMPSGGDGGHMSITTRTRRCTCSKVRWQSPFAI